MKRRNFIKLSMVTGTTFLFPIFVNAKDLDVNQIHFSKSINSSNNAQTIILFLQGGASELGGNLSNLEEIEQKSQNSYKKYFRASYGMTKTKNNFWKEAGGNHKEVLLNDGDMTLFRCCFSKEREKTNNKAHAVCTAENQKGSFDYNSAGIVANLAQILESKGLINNDSIMPFVTLGSATSFYVEGRTPLKNFLKPVRINENGQNPFKRNVRQWYYYTEEERVMSPNAYSSKKDGFDPALDVKMDILAQKKNQTAKIKEAFSKRKDLESFVDKINGTITPNLGKNAYLKNKFSKQIETAVKILIKNPDTKIVTISTGGSGGWDDHSDAKDFVRRSEELFGALRSAMAHIKAKKKEGSINIMVFGEFGRNVNLNDSKGWDHGNLQNFYILGGKNYFNHQGVVGETIVTGKGSRLYLKPKSGTYQFEPLSIAATLYKIYGIENPEILTGGYGSVNI